MQQASFRMIFAPSQLTVLPRLHLTPQIVGRLQQRGVERVIRRLGVEVRTGHFKCGENAKRRFELALPFKSDSGAGNRCEFAEFFDLRLY